MLYKDVKNKEGEHVAKNAEKPEENLDDTKDAEHVSEEHVSEEHDDDDDDVRQNGEDDKS